MSANSQGYTVTVLRNAEEVQQVRRIWEQMQRHPNCDIDFYLLLLRCRPEMLRPHVMALYRDERPEAMLIGRILHQRVEFKVGYKTIFKLKVRLLNFVWGGTLGNFSSENSEALLGEIINCLSQGEADMAVFNSIPTDAPIYHAATRVPGFLSRDHFPALQNHRAMVLPGSVEELHSALSRKVWKNQRWKKLLRDFSGRVTICCLRETAELGRMIRDVEEIAKKTYQRGLGVGFIDNTEMHRCLHLDAQNGRLRTFLLYLADKPCAFWLGTVYQKTFYSGYMGYDPSYGHYSPGMFLVMRTIEYLCSRKHTDVDVIEDIDFGLGDAQYKEILGNRNWQDATVYIFGPTLRGFGVNVLRTPTVVIDRLAKKALERTELLPRIKRFWRDHLRGGDRWTAREQAES